MLPAQRGDCLWITYGTTTRQHHVVVDAGPEDTIATLVPELERRIKALPGGKDRIELLVVTHIDADHIQGVVSLLSAPGRVAVFRDIWFNGYKHHDPDELLGGVDAERLSRGCSRTHALERRLRGPCSPAHRRRGSRRRHASRRPHPHRARTDPRSTHRAGARLSEVLHQGGHRGWQGPALDPEDLATRGVPRRLLDPDALAATRTTTDPSKPNGASIILVAEYDGKRVLLTGDASSKGILTGLDRLGPGRHHFDAVKISHHGSRNNTSLAVAQRIESPLWLVSSNGASFGHPDGECLGRIVVSQQRPTFGLNYVTARVTELIAGAGERYQVRLPKKKRDGTFEEGISISL